MQRVAVIGCGGSGKTTVARELGRILDLPTATTGVGRASLRAKNGSEFIAA